MGADDRTGDVADLAGRVTALEERLRRLESREAPPAGGGAGSSEARFWALEGLKAHVGDPGAVLFTGAVVLPTDERYEWQQGVDAASLLDADWSEVSAALAALAHPVRLVLLREILHGGRTVAELQSHESLGTSGQLYHHLRQLVGAGWLRATSRGRYAVPGERVVPLLVVLAAARR